MTDQALPDAPLPEDTPGDRWDTPTTGNYFGEQVTSIRRLRRWATIVAAFALLSLILALGATVWSFTKQIDKATPAVTEIVSAAKAGQVVGGTSGVVAASPPAPGATPLPGKPVVVATSVSVDISSIGNSVVAVVSVLVVAIAVLAISLLRTTYTLSVLGVGSKSSERNESVDSSIPVPGAELVKAVGEAIMTVVKGVGSKRD